MTSPPRRNLGLGNTCCQVSQCISQSFNLMTLTPCSAEKCKLVVNDIYTFKIMLYTIRSACCLVEMLHLTLSCCFSSPLWAMCLEWDICLLLFFHSSSSFLVPLEICASTYFFPFIISPSNHLLPFLSFLFSCLSSVLLPSLFSSIACFFPGPWKLIHIHVIFPTESQVR